MTRTRERLPSGVHLLAHCHIMKTAGQTVCDILRQSFPGAHCDLRAGSVATAEDVRMARRFYPRLRSISGHSVVPLSDLAQACDSIRFFTFLRDPVKRSVSHYQYTRKTMPPLETWLRQRANYQTRFLCRRGDTDDPWAIPADAERAIELLETTIGFVGLTERFDESLILLRHWCADGRLNIAYRSRNIAPRTRTRDALLADPATAAMIRAYHQADERVYRHVRDVIYPRQVERYGPDLARDLAQLRSRLPGRQTRLVARTVASAKRNLLYKPLARRRLKRLARPTPVPKAPGP